MSIILHQHCKISPPSDAFPEFSLPIIFFDMVWYDFPADQCVLFFDFPCSKSHFLDSIVPDLKKSLSLTLSHFLPFSGNIIHPLTPGKKPILSYVKGDFVSLTVSESDADFNQLTGNHPRVSDEFYAFAPNLPPAIHSTDSITCPVLALQVTLFPENGICLGFVTHHAIADASTIVSFMKAWALINNKKPRGIDVKTFLTEGKCLPFYDRKDVTNLNGLDSIYWEMIVKLSSPVEPSPVKFPLNKFRSTFILKKEQIQGLKNLVLAKRPGLSHLSSFTVTCALVWICSAKSATAGGGEVSDDEFEHFCFVADCRTRLNPPLPVTYFGNCVALVKTELKHGELKGNDGFVMAAASIGEAIKEMVYNENGIIHEAESWPEEYEKLIGKVTHAVAGSPRFDFYGVDYGWGRPKKFEALFVDGDGSISLCNSREFEGGLEIGLSKTKVKMEAFATVFTEVLDNFLLLTCQSEKTSTA